MSNMMRRPSRPVLLAILGVTLLGFAAWHYGSLYREATAARAAFLDLEDTARTAGDLGLDATSADLDVVDAQLVETDGHIDRARWHLRWDPFLQAARWLPVVGDQVVATGALLDIGDALVEVGKEGSTLARTAIETREARQTTVAHAGGGTAPITTTTLNLVEDAGPSLDRIQALLDGIVGDRLDVGDRRLLGPLHDARTRIDEQLPGVVDLVDQAATVQRILPELMGFEGERRYLLLSLNNAELMPGGGLVTGAGIIAVEDGDVIATSFQNSASWLPAWQENGGEFIEAPTPLQRHLLKDYSWNLGVSNWDPDFTVWAHQALEFYELAWGPQDVDGIVAVDLDVLEALLEVTGEQTVEAPGFGHVKLTSENAVMELERVTRAPSDTWRRSKAAVGLLQEALLRDILELPVSRWTDLAEVVQELGDERHIQAMFFNPGAQRLVTDIGWDGRLLAPGEGDYLQFNEASVNSTKLNVVFAPTATYDIEVTALGTARHHLVLRYENTVREWARDYDDDLVQHLMFDGQYGGYLRAFVPSDATRFSATLDGAAAVIEDEGTAPRHRWFGIYVPVPPDAVREAALSWSNPTATDDPATYELVIQKQPGTDGMCIDLNIHRDGVPAALDVTGGTEDGEGRICLTSDVTIRAEFRR